MFLRLVGAWLVIIGVAGFDAYLTAKHGNVMADVEINPVGRMLLNTQGGVPLLIGLKTAGATLALLFCFCLWQNPKLRRKVLAASYCVAGLALGMIVLMHDDSDRTRRVEQYRRGFNSTGFAPKRFVNSLDEDIDGESPDRPHSQANRRLPASSDWSVQGASATVVTPGPIQSGSSAL